MSENDWFANINGREYGPVNIREIKQWIYDGRVTPETMVWNPSMKDWLPAAQTPLFPTGSQYESRSTTQMEGEVLPGELIRAVGNNGSVVVFKNKITIIRAKGLLTFALHGMKGDKEIFISKINNYRHCIKE